MPALLPTPVGPSAASTPLREMPQFAVDSWNRGHQSETRRARTVNIAARTAEQPWRGVHSSLSWYRPSRPATRRTPDPFSPRPPLTRGPERPDVQADHLTDAAPIDGNRAAVVPYSAANQPQPEYPDKMTFHRAPEETVLADCTCGVTEALRAGRYRIDGPLAHCRASIPWHDVGYLRAGRTNVTRS